VVDGLDSFLAVLLVESEEPAFALAKVVAQVEMDDAGTDASEGVDHGGDGGPVAGSHGVGSVDGIEEVEEFAVIEDRSLSGGDGLTRALDGSGGILFDDVLFHQVTRFATSQLRGTSCTFVGFSPLVSRPGKKCCFCCPFRLRNALKE
jgi:hypothetical protein